MASGIAHTVILFSNRTILTYGYNNKKQIEIEKEIAQSCKIHSVYAGGNNTILKIDDDKLGYKLLGYGCNKYKQIEESFLFSKKNIKYVSIGTN